MSTTLAEVHTLYPTNFRDPAATLRAIADDIEAGKFGEITQVAMVMLGDTCEVFHAGPDADGATIATLLQAGAHRMISAVANHGRDA
jgi:hypothetical protein